MVNTSFLCKCSSMDIARAAPSLGSVPAQISSISTKSPLFTSPKILIKLVICAEKVLKLCSMLCSSPISAYTARNTGSFALLAGMNIPDCAIRAKRPTAFKATVLPPVLGPVIKSILKRSPSSTSRGTTLSLLSKG